jgi:hypothetical protein
MNTDAIKTLSDDELDARLRTTFATVMPLLDAPSTATTNAVGGRDSESNDDALVFDLAVAPSSPKPRRMVGILGAAAATVLVLAGLAFAQRDQTETPAASQPSELPGTTIPLDDSSVDGSFSYDTAGQIFPPTMTLGLEGWEVLAGDFDGRFVRYLFAHPDGRQLDVTVEAGGVDVYFERVASLSADAVETIDDISQVADLATIGGYRLDALLEPGSEWVLHAVGAGFADRADFIATIRAFEQSPRVDADGVPPSPVNPAEPGILRVAVDTEVGRFEIFDQVPTGGACQQLTVGEESTNACYDQVTLDEQMAWSVIGTDNGQRLLYGLVEPGTEFDVTIDDLNIVPDINGIWYVEVPEGVKTATLNRTAEPTEIEWQ